MKKKLIFSYVIIHILIFLFSFVLSKQVANSYIYEYKIEILQNKFDRIEDEKLLNSILFGETKKFFSYNTSINYLKELMNENCGLPTAKFNIKYYEQVYAFNLINFNVTFELSDINKEKFQIDDCLYVWLDLAQQNFIGIKKKEIREINQRISNSNALINNLFKIKDNNISEDFIKKKR